MIEDHTYFFAIVGAIGSLATAAAFFILWIQLGHTKKQIQLTQEDIERRLRPWLGIREVRRTEYGYLVVVENTGSMAAKIVRTQQYLSSSPITEKQLRSGEDISSKAVISPNGKRDIGVVDSSRTVNQYLGILLQYEYAKGKHGEIGSIVKYN